MIFSKIPIGDYVEIAVYWIELNLGWLLDIISDFLGFMITGFRDFLMLFPPLIFALLIAALAYFTGKKNLKLAVGTFVGLLLIENLRLWTLSMETLSLVISSAFLALVIGIPLGILAAKSDFFFNVLKPILDLMQTMPSFVYLIPALIFFGLGNVPGMIATLVFAMPPTIRLTNLGIRQVPRELKEVADAFGSTPWQKLVKVELPAALPTIMAGVNQCIMLSLSMVVIAAMIGARGLGYQVLFGIQRVDIGLGFEAGLGIVILAVILDRITQNLSPK
ncbi:ABC transporter permease [Methanosarcina mazei]|uniref:Glycine/betaine ABC transporter n=8 Tax=Methanosarcina mazei TaxID=2209 RepID=A0A0F8RCZ5_METMZ|nr:proline/glycine betaine ABC transporter permease [Methanosarcina mazei]AAM29737.1 Glycine betaine transporter, permease protein [Methanosarcina mazei Go1]AGF95505.1 Glycine betaine ABC transport system, permease protein OpuAB [Methanosarcina mazei Tuc01]AKB40249.1 Glycine betaine ABC transport system, permease protein OpuAB [Methanosarcina mazei WWM610]AKB61171.1 Glycine betaine ABC transport system, permease protein OpuAB [Methanosarcina mazei SarPi]AKB64483.1 Glycine betaine ABC transport